MDDDLVVGGECDPRFAGVRQAFADNFAHRGEHGAAVSVHVDGRKVVDLWGGAATEASSWTGDTLVNAFSIGKGMVALLAARCVGRGELDVDQPVGSVWPEFAAGAAGKDRITIRHLLTHQAGLPAVRRRLPPGAMLDHATMATALAAQEPWWEPGTAHGYHTNTYGFLLGEVLRRVTGRTVGRLLRDEVAGPLGADVHIGLPADEDHRVADFVWPFATPPELAPDPGTADDHRLMVHNTYFNPSGLSGAGVVNTRAWRAAEIPSTNIHASARGVARVYAALAAGGALDGVRIVDRDALAAAAVEQVHGHDRVLGRTNRFGLGFQLTQPERPLGPHPGAYGHFGAGGSLGFCDPEAGVAFGYVMNVMSDRWLSPRNRALIDAVYESLGAGGRSRDLSA
jgi:CubicO group peptidase (beta-lactamase class C family)